MASRYTYTEVSMTNAAMHITFKQALRDNSITNEVIESLGCIDVWDTYVDMLKSLLKDRADVIPPNDAYHERHIMVHGDDYTVRKYGWNPDYKVYTRAPVSSPTVSDALVATPAPPVKSKPKIPIVTYTLDCDDLTSVYTLTIMINDSPMMTIPFDPDLISMSKLGKFLDTDTGDVILITLDSTSEDMSGVIVKRCCHGSDRMCCSIRQCDRDGNELYGVMISYDLGSRIIRDIETHVRQREGYIYKVDDDTYEIRSRRKTLAAFTWVSTKDIDEYRFMNCDTKTAMITTVGKHRWLLLDNGTTIDQQDVIDHMIRSIDTLKVPKQA